MVGRCLTSARAALTGRSGRLPACHVEAADTTFRVHNGDQLVTEVARTTVKPIARFKVRKPEPSRAARTPAASG